MGCLFYVGFIEGIVHEFLRSEGAMGRAPVICIIVSGFVVTSFVSYAVEKLCGGCSEERSGENIQGQQ